MKSLRSLMIATALGSAALSACTTDGITEAGPEHSPTLSVASAPVERPWSGRCDVAATFTGPTTLRIVGTCQLAHLGRVQVVADQTIDASATGITYVNTATYTAPNGDELRTTNVGVAIPDADGLTLAGTETAVGGTGRFADATGTATLAGSVMFTSQTTTIGGYSLDGRLSF